MQDYISVKEATRKYGLSESQIRHLLIAGKLNGKKFAGVWMVDVSSLDVYAATNRKPGPKKGFKRA